MSEGSFFTDVSSQQTESVSIVATLNIVNYFFLLFVELDKTLFLSPLSTFQANFKGHDEFFVINCQLYAQFLLFFVQFYEKNHHYKNVCQIKTKHRKIIFFVSNKSYDIGLSCNNTYFTTTITSYAVEGGGNRIFAPCILCKRQIPWCNWSSQ